MKDHKNKIKEALNKPVPNWDEDGVWEHLDKNLPKKKNKKRFFFLLFFSLLGISLMLSKLSMQEIGNIGASENTNITIDENQENKKIKNEQLERETYLQSSSLLEKEEIILSNTTIKEENPSDKSASDKTSSSKQILNKQTLTSSSQSLISENPTSYNKNFSTNTSDNQSENNTNQTENKTSKSIATKDDQNTILAHTNNSIEPSTNQNTLLDFQKLSFIKLQQLSILDDKMILKNAKLSIVEENTKPLNFYSASFTAGVFYTTRNLQSDIHKLWEQRKNATEQIAESSEYQILVQSKFNNHWSIGTGINFRQTIEVYEDRDSTILSVTPIQHDSTYLINNVAVSGVSNLTRLQYRNVYSPNKFQTVNIPIALGYQFDMKKVTLGITFGSNLKIWQRYSGHSVNLNNNITNDPDELKNLYTSKITFGSTFLSAQLNRRFGAHWDLNLGLKSIVDFNSNIFSDEKEIDLRYKLLGAYLGVSRRF